MEEYASQYFLILAFRRKILAAAHALKAISLLKVDVVLISLAVAINYVITALKHIIYQVVHVYSALL